MLKAPVATIHQLPKADYSTFLQERQQYLRNIYKPTDTEIKFDITTENIHQKKATTKKQIDEDRSLTTQQKKKYKRFIDSLKDVTMNNEEELYAPTINDPNLKTVEYKELAIYLSRNFDEIDCPHNKFFARLAWEKYEKKLKKKITYFDSDLDKIKNLPQYNSVVLTYEELRASWLELQSLPSTLTSIYDRNESRDKLSNDNFDVEKNSLYVKIYEDDSIEKETKNKLLSFVQSFTKSADNKYFSCDSTCLNDAAISHAKTQLNKNDLKKIVTALKRYKLNDPSNYGLEDNWGGFNTYVFRNAFNLYFYKLKDDGIANEKDIKRLITEHPFAKSNAYEFIEEQRKDFASELSEQQTIPFASRNKAIITDNATLKNEIESFRTKFSLTTYKDFDHLGLDKQIVLDIIESNKPSNPYSSDGGINVNFSNDTKHYMQLKCLDCLKVAKYFLKKSREASESLHKDKDGSKKIQINTYLARVFFWLYEQKLPIENFATYDDLQKLRTDIPFEYIGTPQKNNESEITKLLKYKIGTKNTNDFTRFFTNILNYDIAIDKALNEIYRDEQNRDKLKDFLQESDSELAINLRKYILNKYDNIFDTPDNISSLLILKKYSAYGVFKTNSDPDRYEKHDLENAKTHLDNDESVPHEVLNEKLKFTKNSSGILSLPPSPFSTKAVVEQIRSSSKIQR